MSKSSLRDQKVTWRPDQVKEKAMYYYSAGEAGEAARRQNTRHTLPRPPSSLAKQFQTWSKIINAFFPEMQFDGGVKPFRR
jgi:hypothetical protein